MTDGSRQQTADHYHDARPATTMNPPGARVVAVAPIVFSRRMLAHLDMQELIRIIARLCCTCRAIRAELSGTAIWRGICIRRFDDTEALSLAIASNEPPDWRSFYRQTDRFIADWRFKFSDINPCCIEPVVERALLHKPELCEATHRCCAIQLTRARL